MMARTSSRYLELKATCRSWPSIFASTAATFCLNAHRFDGKAMPIGGGERRLPSVELDIYPGQHRAALVAGRRDHGLLDGVLELSLVNLDLPTFHARRHRREIRRVDAPDIGVKPVALDRQRLGLAIQGHRERLVRVRRHEVR